MEFKDFKNNPQELLGKMVLYESGHSYSEKLSKKLCKIEKVLATGFKISCKPNSIFSLDDGYQKGLTGRGSMGVISRCTLLTDEEAKELSLKWKRSKEERELRQRMKAKVDTMTYEQLLKMEEL